MKTRTFSMEAIIDADQWVMDSIDKECDELKVGNDEPFEVVVTVQVKKESSNPPPPDVI